MNQPPSLVMVLVDALAASYVQPEAMPFLSHLADQGRKVALSPSPFFSGADSILYGMSGAQLGLFTGYCFAPQRSPYRAISTIYYPLSTMDWLPCHRWGKLLRTLWARHLLGRAGAEWLAPQFFPSALLEQIAAPKPHRSESRHIVHRVEQAGHRARWYTRDFPFETKKWLGSQWFACRYKKEWLRWLTQVEPQGPPNLLLFELSVELDRFGHRYGPRLEGALLKAVKRIDDRLQSLWEAMQSWPGLHWLVISDHGMSQVERTYNLQASLGRAGLFGRLRYNMILSSTLAQFCVDDPALKQELHSLLQESRQGTTIRFEEFEQHGIPPDRSWGDLVFVVPEGTLVLPNHFQGHRAVKGMHGYASSTQESSRPVAVFWGEQWRYEQAIQGAPMTSLYSIILGLYGLEP